MMGASGHSAGVWTTRNTRVVGGELRSGIQGLRYSASKPWLVNFRERLFSVTVRTT